MRSKLWLAKSWSMDPGNHAHDPLGKIVADPAPLQKELIREFSKMYAEIVAETPSDKKITTHPMHTMRYNAKKYQISE